jgi:hypothetical protein
MTSIRCPVCGHRVRVVHYKTGGGKVDCFACGRVWLVIYTSGCLVIQKIRYDRPHRSPVSPALIAGGCNYPLKTGPGVRQVPNDHGSKGVV